MRCGRCQAGPQLARIPQPLSSLSCRAQLRMTTLLVVDALKSITYAFLLGQRVAHQSGDAWLDAAVTLATTVAAPELVMSCLEARARSMLC